MDDRNPARRTVTQAARRPFTSEGLMVLPGLVWLLVFAVVPFGLLVCMSLWTATVFGIEQDWTLDNYRTLAADPVYIIIVLKTVRIAAVSTALCLLVSYPVALCLARRRGPAKDIMLFLLFLPFWSSYLVRSFIWLPILGRNGLINGVLVGSGLLSHPLDALIFNEAAVYVGLVYVYALFMRYRSISRSTGLCADRHVTAPPGLHGGQSGTCARTAVRWASCGPPAAADTAIRAGAIRSACALIFEMATPRSTPRTVYTDGAHPD